MIIYLLNPFIIFYTYNPEDINLMIQIRSLWTFFILALCLCITLTQDFSQYQITKVDRIVQLNSAYPQQVVKVQYKCLNQVCDDSVYYSQTQQQAERTSHIIFNKDKQSTVVLQYSSENYRHNGQNYVLYKVQLKNRLYKDQTFILAVTIIYLNRYINYPQSIDLTEDQKFQYEDNKKFLAPYWVKEASVTYKFSKLLGYQQDGEKKGLSTVLFKSLDFEPFTYIAHRIHGVNNEPQVYFSEVVREIQVSHWGNIAITEFYKMKNVGPEMKGEFSRVQFSSNNKFQAKNAWRGTQTLLPYQIWGLYYRDEVGNISTSRAYRDDHSQTVRFALAPRYALLGGWKANWQIGYNLNTKDFLTHDGDNFQLNKVPIQYALSTILAEKYTIRVILPEGSTNVNLFIGSQAVEMNKVTQGISFGYLDFAGRPTFTIDNLRGSFKDVPLKVTYQFQQTAIFKKPLIVFAAIFSILLILIVLKRLNMSAFDDRSIKMNKPHTD